MKSSLKLANSFLEFSLEAGGGLILGMRELSSEPTDWREEGLPRASQIPPMREPVIAKLSTVPASRAFTASRDGLVN